MKKYEWTEFELEVETAVCEKICKFNVPVMLLDYFYVQFLFAGLKHNIIISIILISLSIYLFLNGIEKERLERAKMFGERKEGL